MADIQIVFVQPLSLYYYYPSVYGGNFENYYPIYMNLKEIVLKLSKQLKINLKDYEKIVIESDVVGCVLGRTFVG